MRCLPPLALAATLGALAPSVSAEASQSIAIEQPWARATPGGARTGAVYLTVKNRSKSADRLVGGSSPIAQKVQVHQMDVAGGIIRMRELDHGLSIPAQGAVALEPGTYHLMLVGLKGPLTAGQPFALTLTFQKAGVVAFTVPVVPIGASGPGAASPLSTGNSMKMEAK